MDSHRRKQRREILDLAGQVEWAGNLDEMREGRSVAEWSLSPAVMR
jgi:hypothetical protein